MRGRKDTKKKEILSIKWGMGEVRGEGKSLNVGLLFSEVGHFFFFPYWPLFSSFIWKLAWSGVLLFFPVGTFAGVSIIRPLPNLEVLIYPARAAFL